MWHLLSLDAPSVAAVWTVFVAGSVGLRLPWTEPAAMFVAVWMIYAADRLLDARVLDLTTDQAPSGLEARHRFHHAHRRGFMAGLLAAAMLLVYLLHRMDARQLRLYALLATALAVWMLFIHARGRNDRRLPKETAVGLFFAAAMFIPTVSHVPALRASLLPMAPLFAGVCALNCLLLYAWEHAAQSVEAHWTTRWAARRLDGLSLAWLIACGTVGVWRHGSAVAIACGLSVALLWTVHRLRNRLAAVHLRALADLVLLTPLLWMVR